MKVAAAGGVLGEKIMMDSTFNSLVNDQGNIYVKYLKNLENTASEHQKLRKKNKKK